MFSETVEQLAARLGLSLDDIDVGEATATPSPSTVPTRPDKSPTMDQPPPALERVRRDMHREEVAGRLTAALRRPPSWSDPAARPFPGCFCSCCRGQSWWAERQAPRGWRCRQCHPSLHLGADQIVAVGSRKAGDDVPLFDAIVDRL
jgi:hypothetical protein